MTDEQETKHASGAPLERKVRGETMRFNRIFLDEMYKKKHAIESEIDRQKLIDTFDGEQSAAIHAAKVDYLEEMRKTINWLITEYLETHNP